jgi:hypothetical protein
MPSVLLLLHSPFVHLVVDKSVASFTKFPQVFGWLVGMLDCLLPLPAAPPRHSLSPGRNSSGISNAAE